MGQGKEGGCIFLLIISKNVLDLNSPVLHPYTCMVHVTDVDLINQIAMDSSRSRTVSLKV